MSDENLDDLFESGDSFDGLDDLLGAQADASIKADIEQTLLLKILSEQDTRGFNWLVSEGMTRDTVSPVFRDLFDYVQGYRREYGIVPDLNTVKRNRSSAYQLVAGASLTKTPVEALYDELLKERVIEEITRMGAGIAEQMKQDVDGYDVLDFVTAHVAAIQRNYTRTRFRAVSTAEMVDPLKTDYLDSAAGVTRGVPIPFLFLQEALGGWRPTGFSAVVAKPGVGKTFYELLCADAAVHGDPFRWFQPADLEPYTEEKKKAARVRVLLDSLEMGNIDISRRLSALHAKISFAKIRGGLLTDEEREEYFEFLDSLKAGGVNEWIGQSLKIVGPGTASTVSQIAAQAEDFGAGMVIVDGFYLLEGEGKEAWQKVTSNTRNARLEALKSGVHWMIASQLNRAARGRDSTSLDTLAYSSSIGYDCTEVVALSQTPQQKQSRQVDMMALKVRDGDVGVPWVYNWNPVAMAFGQIGRVMDAEESNIGVSGGVQSNY